MNKSTFCILPFNHLEARADGFIAPCCMSQSFFQDDEGKFFHLSKDSLNDVWTSKAMSNLRTNLLSGVKDSKCSSCWSEEATGKTSKRLRENSRWQLSIEKLQANEFIPNPPEFLDLKLGNTCNLKCRICGPASSSGWIREWKDVTGEDQLEQLSRAVMTDHPDKKLIMSWPDMNDRFWSDIEKWLPDIKLFEMYGGEPFLIKRHFDLLKKSVEKGYSKNQNIHYNTNGTIFPDAATTEIWPHFNRVDIMLSIDGIGEQFEYQRHPAKWIDTEKNIFRFLECFSPKDLHICLTVSSLNAYYLGDYLKYFNKIGVPVWLNILYGPDHFCIKNLPQKAKDAILEKWEEIGEEQKILLEPLEPLKKFLTTTWDPNQFKLLKDSLSKHDKYRGESYRSVFPEFADILWN